MLISNFNLVRTYCILIFVVFGTLFSSCEKPGCTDPHSLNYSVEATSDDGSCKIAETVRIKSVEVKVTKTTDEDGIEWDASGLPDCFIEISTFGNPTLYESEIIQDVTTDEAAVFVIEPNLVFTLDSLEEFDTVDFVVYDDDGSTRRPMAGASLYLDPEPEYGGVLGGSFFYQRFKLVNNHGFSSQSFTNQYNNHVSIILNLEWE